MALEGGGVEEFGLEGLVGLGGFDEVVLSVGEHVGGDGKHGILIVFKVL